MTTGKTIALTRWTFVGKVMSLLFNTLSRLVIAFFPKEQGASFNFRAAVSRIVYCVESCYCSFLWHASFCNLLSVRLLEHLLLPAG